MIILIIDSENRFKGEDAFITRSQMHLKIIGKSQVIRIHYRALIER
jgi:hypothetical protein